MRTEPLVPSWVWDVGVLCMLIVPFVVLWLCVWWEEAAQRRMINRELEEDALDLRLAIGLYCADRDKLLEPPARPPDDVQ